MQIPRQRDGLARPRRDLRYAAPRRQDLVSQAGFDERAEDRGQRMYRVVAGRIARMDDGTLVPIPAIDFNRIVHIDRVLLRKYPAASVQQIASAGRSWTYFSYRGLLAGAAS